MEIFTKLFCSLLVFVYHCFDRIVINGYLKRVVPTGSRWFIFRSRGAGIPVVSKEVLKPADQRYRNWVEAYHAIIRPHRVGGKRVFARKTMCSRAATDGEEKDLWSLLHLQEHGARPDISDQHAEVSTQDPNHRIL